MIFTQNLNTLGSQLKSEFQTATPFPHIVVDNLFNEDILTKAISEIKNVQGIRREYKDKNQIKQLIEGKDLLTSSPDSIKNVFAALNSTEFVNFLQELTDVDSLFADDTFRGGGIHSIKRGGKLGVHIDFSRPSWNTNVYRRVNALLYLNQNWEQEYGGDLELWDDSAKNGGTCIKKIAPTFNRLVVFGTKKASWHGHPTPLNSPDSVSRLSFAAYYYSNTPSDDLDEHTTIFS